MRVQQNFDLKELNTFGFQSFAYHYIEVSNLSEVKELTQFDLFKQNSRLILGGGSNILLTKDFDGLVIKNSIKGIEIISEDDNHVWLKIGAGEVWHEFVMHCIDSDFGGVENLSLIPGSVGAAPMQNIGAYGVEIVQVFDSLEAVHLTTGEVRVFENHECEFGYRESIFKHKMKGEYMITSVTFKLTKQNHLINTSYGAIQDTLSEMGISSPTIKDVSNAVISIRQSKLPDPKEIGNAGSFFKNPTIDKIDYESLQAEFPTIPGYQLPDQKVKVPAGWLIEQCGWKGKTLGEIGVHAKQALVLVNYGNGNGESIKNLAMEIKQSVLNKYGIEINPEVNFV